VERQIEQVDFSTPSWLNRKRVAAYARVSSGKDAMLHSLSAQVSYYSNLIQSNPEWKFCGVYADEALTGTKDNRDNFQRLLDDCRAGLIDMVITKSISRLARNTVTLLATVRQLKELGVDVFFEEQNIHTMSADGELMLTLLASFAQEESLSASENQKWRIRKAFERGELINIRFLFGYTVEKEVLTIHPEHAQIVREVFNRAIAGESFKTIAEDLEERGVPRENGGHWCHQRIRDLLSNEKYLGHALLQKHYTNNHLDKKVLKNNGELPRYFVQNIHPAIIDQETFDKAQELLARLDEKRGTRKPATLSVFSGKIKCPKCGKPYRRQVRWNVVAWNCDTFLKRGKKYCHGKKIPQTALEATCCKVLGIAEFDPVVFKREIDHLVIPEPNHIQFIFRDGRMVEEVWKDRSRSESWTPEMRAKAREQLIARGGQFGAKTSNSNSGND